MIRGRKLDCVANSGVAAPGVDVDVGYLQPRCVRFVVDITYFMSKARSFSVHLHSRCKVFEVTRPLP